MANIMEQKDVQNHVHRNGFDLSFRNAFTAKCGELLPVFCKEVLPGDKWKIDVSSFTRVAPIQTAAFTRMMEYIDFYFVPNSLLWDKFNNYIVQTNNYNHSKGLSLPPDKFKYHPYFTTAGLSSYGLNARNAVNAAGMDAITSTEKLLSYLYGYNSSINVPVVGGKSVSLNIFPLLAYQKIYYDYFRYSQWETSKPQNFNLDWVFSSNQCSINLGSLSFGNDISGFKFQDDMLTLRYANYRKDLFMGLLPNAQFGDTSAFEYSHPFADHRVNYSFSGNGENGVEPLPNSAVRFSDGGTLVDSTGTAFPQLNLLSMDSANDINLSLSVFMLRFMEASQKWKEITQSGDLDYQSQIYKHWNVRVPNAESYKCQWLGGNSGSITISDVTNTNLSTEEDQATLAGKGLGTIKGKDVNFNSDTYGWIIGIYHVEPLLDWRNNGIARQFLKISADDYAIPEYDNLGMVSVPLIESFYSNEFLLTDKLKISLGYAPRYYDYKTSIDVVNGAFNTVLKDWVAPLNNEDFATSIVKYGNYYRNFKIRPSALDSLFVAQASSDDTVDSDQFYIAMHFDTKVVRNLSVSGLPY